MIKFYDMKIHIQRKVVDELADKLEIAYHSVNDELLNERIISTNYTAGDLMEIDKDDLDIKIDSMLSVLKKLKKIKKFNINDLP